MSEICKKCGRDTTTDKTYHEITETPGAESYILCNECYPLNCPKCGVEMESFDPGADFEADCKGEYLTCEKCNVWFGVTIWVRKWWFWYSQYCRDMGMPKRYEKSRKPRKRKF